MNFDASFEHTVQIIDADFNEAQQMITADMGEVQIVTEYVGGDPFEGDYSVTPKVEAQTMPTKEKVMLDDVTIEPIPYAEVTNNFVGNF